MKACPQCKQQFSEADEFCPHHGLKLLALSAVAGGGGVVYPVSGPPDPGTPADRLAGTTLDGRYELTELLGEGGMGVVYRARHTVIEKPVAVKLLKKDVSRDGNVVKRFIQEAKAASRIGHANIVDMTDFGTLPDGTPYAVMEFIDGVTLSKALRTGGPMTAARALPIIAQLARALAAAHDKGIVHRDLKPENIFLVDREGRRDFVKIVDFGIAKVAPLEGMGGASRLTRAGSVFGTPEYMAPEQAAGKPDTDQRVDVYAVGTILYEMLAGRVPFKEESLVATLAAQMLDPVKPPRELNPNADITDALEAVIMKALAKDKEERYPSMMALYEALEVAADGVPLEPMVAAGSSRAYAVPRPRGETIQPIQTAPADSATVIPAAARPTIGEQPARRRSRRLALAAVFVGVAAAGTLALALVVAGKSNKGAAADAGAPSIVAAGGGADAAPTGVRGTAPDAGVVAIVAKPDASLGASVAVRPVDPRPPLDPAPPDAPPLDVIVKTVPPGGDLFVDGDAAGTDGTTFHRPRGTKLTVKCTKKGHEPGRASLVFDGSVTEVACKMKRKPICKDDMKNPFDDCP